jgi:glutamyl-Q tRNA(Asp) synthetase
MHAGVAPSTQHNVGESAARYRGRFAPSPTGPLHFGSLIAAAASYLEARSRGGTWVIRIEDLDTPRVVPGAADDILRALEKFGMAWDGPIVYQSARNDAYHAQFHRLRALNVLYPCACSRREIADSAAHGIEGPVYPGTCRKTPPTARPARAWRIHTRDVEISFDDAIQGRVAQNLASDIGDFVLLRADRIYAYQFAVVVDDTEQGITDVVRGADLLDSTPRQIYLQRLLNLVTPRYCHVPIAVNASGEKLSKQTGATAIDCTRPASALTAALQFLDHSPPASLDGAGPAELLEWAIAAWRTDRVPRRRAVMVDA